jgi:hypothetical protein
MHARNHTDHPRFLYPLHPIDADVTANTSTNERKPAERYLDVKVGTVEQNFGTMGTGAWWPAIPMA